MTTGQIVIIGAAIVFGVPITAGLVAGYFLGATAGSITGFITFVVILLIAHRRIMSLKGKDDDNKRE